jgi:phenylpropionate dioxygenase-like ring-hydroxylating dioxygenase large terminal subunit
MTSFIHHPAVRRAWHAVARGTDVDGVPLGVRVCGEDLVVWRNDAGTVSAAPDRCPHRESPLSIGRVVDGVLECAYHGWSFAGDGHCVLVPSAERSVPIPPRAHLACVPAEERYGLVWVALESPAPPLPAVPEDVDGAFRRIVEPPEVWRAAATRLVDNFCDVAHFPYVHAGTLGAAADRQVPRVTLEALGDWYGYRYDITAANDGAGALTSGQVSETVERRMTTGFALPFLVRSTIEYAETGLRHVLMLASTPVDDDSSLFTFVVWRNDDRSVPDDDVIAFDRAIGAEDKCMLEQIPGTLPLDAVTLVNTQSDRLSVEWRRRLRALLDGETPTTSRRAVVRPLRPATRP